MGIDNYITDPKNHKNAHIFTHNDKDNSNGLVVATHPLKTYENEVKFFISDTYGVDMNIGKTVEKYEYIHNGTDNVYWIASETGSGKFTFNSTDQAHAGTKSIKYDNGNNNDVLQLTRASDITLIGYTSLTLWIYVDKDWKAGDSIEIKGWDTGIGTIVGSSVKLEDYFAWNIHDTWHKISIPLKDMILTEETIDAIKIEIVANEGKQPKFYMDDIQFEGLSETTELGEFIIEPDPATWFHIDQLIISIADNIAGTIANGTMPSLSYNKILGETKLTNGLLYQRMQDGIIISSTIIQQLSDWLQRPYAELISTISDGTNTFITINLGYSEPLLLKAENKDKLRILILDNLSGLLLLRISVSGKTEQRQ